MLKKISVFIFLFIVSLSCSDKEKNGVKSNLDTVRNSVKKDIDTLTNRLVPNDTLFSSVTVKEVVVDGNYSENFQENLEDIFENYVEIKDELADNDSVDSKKHAVEMLEEVTKSFDKSAKDPDKNWSMEGNKIMKYQKIIESSNTLDEQREWFSKLTASLTEAVEKYGLPGKTIYEVETSPQDGMSGKWLTDSKDRDDPYNGKTKDEDTGSLKVLRAWDFKKK
ncbi:MAG: DUF3347 domain-containing protein [Ignavibacteria bacterium]